MGIPQPGPEYGAGAIPPPVPLAELAARGDVAASTEGVVMELAIHVGDLLSASGVSAKDTVAVMRRVCGAYGLDDAQIDITTYALTASYHPPGGLPPITVMRTVSPTVADLSQVAEANHLVSDIVDGLPLERARARLGAIRRAKHPYPSWIAWVAAGSISLAVQLLFTTSPRVLLIALVTGVLLNRLIAGLALLGVPSFFRQLVGGWYTVTVAALTSFVNRVGEPGWLVGASPTLVAVGCIFQLVVGMKFVAALQDAIDGFYVTGTARLTQVLLETAGIVVGLYTGLDLANRTGLWVYISPHAYVLATPPVQYVAAVAAAAVWVVGSFGSWRVIVLTAGAGFLAWLGYSLALQAGAGPVLANFAGAVLAALAATTIVRGTRQPGFAIVAASVVALVPGMTLYEGLLFLVGTSTQAPDTARGWAQVGLAASVALAIAAGATLGTYFGRPLGGRVMAPFHRWRRAVGVTGWSS